MSDGQTSNKGYIEQLEDDSFGEGEPVSAARAWTLRNNLQHCRDSFTQVRVLCVAEEPLLDQYVAGANQRRIVAPFPFPHTWFGPAEPTNLTVLAFAVLSTAATGTIRMRVVPHRGANGAGKKTVVGDLTLPALVDQAEDFAATTNAIARGFHRFDAAVVASLPISPSRPTGRSLDADGAPVVPTLYAMRLDVIIETDVNVICRYVQAFVMESA